MQLADRRTQKK